ncbi:hypothetical protein [Microbispora hainanensis]|uniref:Uncharacterized protein n=1 Tax=Microbispora hainanensis TaxID=568844 RepID=A0ABZ1SWD5_9ACTN|nr:hypothetical protein [Microbispora hainanensis]
MGKVSHAGARDVPRISAYVPADSCAEVTVPLDHRRPPGRTITITISRLPATDPARRRGVLLTTGGGPGGPGVPHHRHAPARRRRLLTPPAPAVLGK